MEMSRQKEQNHQILNPFQLLNAFHWKWISSQKFFFYYIEKLENLTFELFYPEIYWYLLLTNLHLCINIKAVHWKLLKLSC